MKRLLVLAVALGAAAAPMAALAQGERPTYEKPLSTEAVRDVQARLHALGLWRAGRWRVGVRHARRA